MERLKRLGMGGVLLLVVGVMLAAGCREAPSDADREGLAEVKALRDAARQAELRADEAERRGRWYLWLIAGVGAGALVLFAAGATLGASETQEAGRDGGPLAELPDTQGQDRNRKEVDDGT